MTGGTGLRPLRWVLQALLNAPARRALHAFMPATEARDLLDRTWALYPGQLATVDTSTSLGVGPGLVMRLAACTIALYSALLETGQTAGAATGVTGAIAWAIYRRMGRLPWLLSRLVSRAPLRRLEIATRIFRRFPFSPTTYVFRSRRAPHGTVAFDCLRCPVAEHFVRAGFGDLCVQTFCNLDFPLARDWSAVLHRTGSIAGGAPLCDFRWQTTAIDRASADRAALSPAIPQVRYALSDC